MDNQIKTSFIPRKTIDEAANFQTGSQVVRRRVGRTIFSVIATIIFISSLVGAGVVYTWQIKLKKDIATIQKNAANKAKAPTSKKGTGGGAGHDDPFSGWDRF